MLKLLLILFSFQFLLLSCGKEEPYHFDSRMEMEELVTNPTYGFIGSYKSGNLLFETLFEPASLKDSIVVVKLRISEVNGKSVLEHQTTNTDEVRIREQYLSFEIAKDISLEVNGKESAPILTHYERNYRLKPSIDLFFEFKKTEPAINTAYFNYRDKLFGAGRITIKIDTKNFNSSYHD